MSERLEISVQKALRMKDSNAKLRRLNDLMLRVEYLSPLWYRLSDEGNRLLEAGYWYIDIPSGGGNGKRN